MAWSGRAEQTSAETRHAADAQYQQGQDILRLPRREKPFRGPNASSPDTTSPKIITGHHVPKNHNLLSCDIHWTPLTPHCTTLRAHRCACICTLCRIRRSMGCPMSADGDLIPHVPHTPLHSCPLRRQRPGRRAHPLSSAAGRISPELCAAAGNASGRSLDAGRQAR